MRTYTTFAIMDNTNDCLVILGRCSREQLERDCKRMNEKEGRERYYIKEVETW